MPAVQSWPALLDQLLNGESLSAQQATELMQGWLSEQIDPVLTGGLLAAMRAQTRPVKAKRLGVIGRDHFYQLFTGMGCIAESFEYRKVTAQDGMPYVIETAFAHRDKEDDEHNRSNRLIFTGVNWSSAINNPWRSFGNIGEGLESILAKNFISGNEPILLAVHLAHPRVEYTDRGKSAMVLSDEPKQEGDDK